MGGGSRVRFLVDNNNPPPLFFVSGASKGVSDSVSLVESTLTRRAASVDSRGVIGGKEGE
jgi:hypothetical protein